MEQRTFVPKPQWLRRPPASHPRTRALKRVLRQAKLHTVCEEAKCPNIVECFSRGTATFMILGDVCTRGCRFCAVTTGKPHMASSEFASEAQRVAEAANALNLRHVVVTSVARDDLPDGGASGFVETVHALRRQIKGVTVEVLIPDFRGNDAALEVVIAAEPDILNHNLETVPRLYRRVRPGASYQRSLSLLRKAKASRPSLVTKTGVMLGLGEQRDEVRKLMEDCRAHLVESFTAGQYLQPTRSHLPVEQYVPLEHFREYEAYAREIGFQHVAIGALVRSSYHAEEQVSGKPAFQ